MMGDGFGMGFGGGFMWLFCIPGIGAVMWSDEPLRGTRGLGLPDYRDSTQNYQ